MLYYIEASSEFVAGRQMFVWTPDLTANGEYILVAWRLIVSRMFVDLYV